MKNRAHQERGNQNPPSVAKALQTSCHRLIMTLAYALPAARAALPRLGRAPRLRPAFRSRRVAVRAAADQPFDLQNYQEAVVAE